jgi:outer membrane protein assembly factor BamD (BamD/ComL family)
MTEYQQAVNNMEQANYRSASTNFKQVLGILERANETKSSVYLHVLSSLAYSLLNTEEYVQSEDHFKHCIELTPQITE